MLRVDGNMIGGIFLTMHTTTWSSSNWDGGGFVGGGEVLNIFGKEEVIYGLSESAYNVRLNAPKAIICLTFMLMLAMVYGLVRIFGVFNSATLANMRTSLSLNLSVDKKMWQMRKFLNAMVALQSRGIFKLDAFRADDLTFNLNRLGWKLRDIPLTAEMYNGLKIFASFISLVAGLLLSIIVGNPIMLLAGAGAVVLISSLDAIIAMRVHKLDEEISKNFLELYLILYHTMVADGGASLVGLLRVYLATAEGEMAKVTERIIYSIDTYGEALGCDKLTNEFRHEYVTRLMRLIRGYVQGADVRDDLRGFRSLLIENREREIEHESERLQAKARMSFYILMPVLAQAIVSAMAIYFGDITSVGSMF